MVSGEVRIRERRRRGVRRVLALGGEVLGGVCIWGWRKRTF